MTIETGRYYCGMFGISQRWLYVRSIYFLGDGTSRITFLVHDWQHWRWLRRFGRYPITETVERFVARIDQANREMEKQRVEAEAHKIVKKVDSIEVRYR